MKPLIAEHQGIEIRYGWSVREDIYYAHFDLLTKPMKLNVMQTIVRTSISPGLMAGKNHVEAHTEEAVLQRARSAIASYMDEA